jgi:hypothetical protein
MVAAPVRRDDEGTPSRPGAAMNLLSLLPWRRQPRACRATRPEDSVLPALAGDDEDRPRGCGWFDSSHDLRHGLSVCEHASPDTLARELPLANWIDLQLVGWRAAAPRANRA